MDAEWIPSADWQHIDATLVSLAKKKGELDVEIGRWLLAAHRERVDRKRGYGSFTEYVERQLGYDARTTREKLRVARALAEMPRLQQLLRSGERSWSAVREIARVATPETEGQWIEKTERMTVRQIEACVAGRKAGELPTDLKDPLLTNHRMVFDCAPEDFALIEEALEAARREIGPAATRAEAMRAVAERALGARPEREPAYQTKVTVCVHCERTFQQAGGHMIEVSPAIGDCARCDGEIVGITQIDEAIANLETTPVGRDDKIGDLGTTHVGHGEKIGELETVPVDPAVSSRLLLRIASKMFGRHRKSMTPRLRGLAKARDQGRCIVPGCTNFRFVDLHHHRPRHQGGPNTLEGSPLEGLRVRHANGSTYGAPINGGGSLNEKRP